jgi:hypothetical protein
LGDLGAIEHLVADWHDVLLGRRDTEIHPCATRQQRVVEVASPVQFVVDPLREDDLPARRTDRIGHRQRLQCAGHFVRAGSRTGSGAGFDAGRLGSCAGLRIGVAGTLMTRRRGLPMLPIVVPLS